MLLLVCAGWIIVRALLPNIFQRTFGLGAASTPTPQIQIIYVVATSVPAETPTPTTEPISPTLSAVSPTPRGGRTPTPTRRALPTPSTYSAPALVGPPDAAAYSGADASIILEWQPISANGLAESEWYRISISLTGRDGKVVEQVRWSKETRSKIPAAWWNDLAPQTRVLQWNVTVVAVDGVDPFASPNYTRISPPSATRTFIWN